MKDCPRLALRELTIKNFKVLDELILEFPAPTFNDEPDVIVLGSENGMGKTSVLQCIALLTMAPVLRRHLHLPEISYEFNLDLPDLLIRAGHKRAEITGKFQVGNKYAEQRVVIERYGELEINEVPSLLKDVWSSPKSPEEATHLLLALVGMSPDPLLQERLLFFHSYRKVQEGNPDFGSVMDGPSSRSYRGPRGSRRNAFSAFKMEILRLMMGEADLFEDVAGAPGEKGALDELNGL